MTFRLRGSHDKIRQKVFHAEKPSRTLSLMCLTKLKRPRGRNKVESGPRGGEEVGLVPAYVGYLHQGNRFILTAIESPWRTLSLG